MEIVKEQEAKTSQLSQLTDPKEETLNSELVVNSEEMTIISQETTLNSKETTLNSKETTLNSKETTLNYQETTLIETSHFSTHSSLELLSHSSKDLYAAPDSSLDLPLPPELPRLFPSELPPDSPIQYLQCENAKFKVASRKRMDEFLQIFPEIPETLIDDFTCAWLKDILIHGRMYITEDSVCFHSKIIWTYKTVIKLCDIIQVEKKAVAGFFQNAIEISTKDSKFFFGSFISRETAYDMLTKILASHPNTFVFEAPPSELRKKTSKESLKGKRESLGIAKNIQKSVSQRSISLDDKIINNNIPPLLQKDPGLANISSTAAAESHIIHQKVSVPHIPKSDPIFARPLIQKSASLSTLPGAACDCPPRKVMVGQCVVNIPLKTVWEHLFSYDSAKNAFCKQFWEKEKYRDVQVSDWSDSSPIESGKHVLFSDLAVGMARSLNMIVPISNPLAPKESRCNIKEKILKVQPGILCISQTNETPDVPSGTCFYVDAKFCLSLVSENSTRISYSFDIVFTQSTWFKGILFNAVPIERALPPQMKDYFARLITALPAMDTGVNDISITNEITLNEPETLHVNQESTSGKVVHFLSTTSFFVAFSVILIGIVVLHVYLLWVVFNLTTRVDEMTSIIEGFQIKIPIKDDRNLLQEPQIDL